MDKNKDYYIGIDPGVGSVGWAVADTDYNLLRLKGKDAFGAHIFPEASDAKGWRLLRDGKRRVNRRKRRIFLLNELFAESITKIDDRFFLRLQSSTLHSEDKPNGINRLLLFKKRKEEKEYYRNYPTIWHLRLALINDDEAAYKDIRYLYFALHHIIKYRGNFLIDGKFDATVFDYKELFDDLNQSVNEISKDSSGINMIDECDYKSIFEIIGSNESINDKKKKLKGFLKNEDDKKFYEAFYLMAIGAKFTLDKLDLNDNIEINFSKGIKEEQIPVILSALGEYSFLFEQAKKINDFYRLRRLLGDHKYLSEVFVEIYKKHDDDLKLTKKILHDIDKGNGIFEKKDGINYYKIYKDEENLKGYRCYVHDIPGMKRPDDNGLLVKSLDEIIEANKQYVNEDDYRKYQEAKASKLGLFPLISVNSTSLIPHQLHQIELEKILENSKKHFPTVFTDDMCQKLEKLFLFRVPYYCGPLDDRSKNYSNVVRRSNETVTPWNFEDVVDLDASRQKFINRLIGNCQYLYAEPVLPKSSLEYEEYMILDRLNTMFVNGAKLTMPEKEAVFAFIHRRVKTDVQRDLKKYLSSLKTIKINEISISGINLDVSFSSYSYAYLSKRFGENLDYAKFDEIIRLRTIFSDDANGFKQYIRKLYPEFTKEDADYLSGLKTNKWATVSHKFLNGISSVDENGVCHYTILELLRTTDKNFQQILNDKIYHFNDVINHVNDVTAGKTTDDIIQDIMEETPAKFRRPITKCLNIIEEIIQATGKEPKKIFIEVTREESQNKTTPPSRYNELKSFLDGIDFDVKTLKSYVKTEELKSELEEGQVTDQLKLKAKSKHVYLYFKQLRIDMYTGERIQLSDVLNSELYDTDHIVPQSLIKDDSLDNLVLVSRRVNQREKQDQYPLPLSIRNSSNMKMWKFMFEKGMISEKKYNNLVRASTLSEAEVNAFVNSQLNAVNQSNISLRNVLKLKYPDTVIVFSKAHFPSYLRKTLSIPKMRGNEKYQFDLSDTHHAVDAYLNIVAGNILSTYFSDPSMIYKRKVEDHDQSRTFNMEAVLDLEMRNKELREKIQSTCFRHSIIITYAPLYGDAGFYNQTVYTKDKKNLYPLHTKTDSPYNDTSKYGGYSSLTTSYFYLVSYMQGKKKMNTLLNVKRIYELQCKNDEELKKLLITANGLDGPKIKNLVFKRKIACGSKVLYKNGVFRLRAKNENQLNLENVIQCYLDSETFSLDSNSSYLKFAINHYDALSVDRDSVEIRTDLRGKNTPRVISKKKNYSILCYLIEYSKKAQFDKIGYILPIRKLDDEDKFNLFTLKQQIDIIVKVFQAFYKPDFTLLKKYYPEDKFVDGEFKPSVNLDGPFAVLDESVTGLYCHKWVLK